MVGIHDVALRAGVSSATVSRALSGAARVSPATRERVMDAVAELGYVTSSSASSLATGRTRVVGVVIPFLNRWYYGEVLEGVQEALFHHGYDLAVYNLASSGSDRARVFEQFLPRKRVDAVIAVSLELTPDEIGRLISVGKPLVAVGGPLPGVHTLGIDDVGYARMATEHLLGLGHTRIAHLGASLDSVADFHLPTNRRRGYEDALRDAGIEPDPELFRAADFTMRNGYQVAKQLLGRSANRPSAIFAASDEMAFGVMLAARDLGIHVPSELSVIGIDDHADAEFFGLTTIAQYPHSQGSRAVEVLMDQLRGDGGRPDALNTPIPFELVVRSSTSRPGGPI
ncbi:MAG: LacI family DNA-binding transcriptional regulator [Protaetiibacter sp.]